MGCAVNAVAAEFQHGSRYEQRSEGILLLTLYLPLSRPV